MILERDELLTSVKARLDEASRGTGSVILVGGEAGSGKTSIVRETVARWGHTVTVVHGACDPLTTARPLGPFLEIMAHDALRPGLPSGDTWSAADISAALLRELAAVQGPVLVVVEDLHWADDGTLDAIRFLARRVEQTRAILLATYRDDEIADRNRLVTVLGQLRRMPSTHHLETARLSVDAVRLLVAETNVDLDADFVRRRTGGNAFFVTEMLAARGPMSTVPGNVQAAVLARVTGLGPGARRLVEVVAIAPRALEYDHAMAVSGAADEDLDEAIAVGVLSLERGWFEFRHELARLAVEQSIPSGRRRRYHRTLVERLVAAADAAPDGVAVDVSRIAHHAVELGDGELVLHYGLLAADNAEARGSNRQACQYLGHVLHVADGVDAARVNGWRIRLGSLLRLVGDFEAAIVELEQAAADCRRRSDSVQLMTALRHLSNAHRDVGERTTAESLADRAVAAAQDSGEPIALAQALTHRGFLAMLARRPHTAIELASRGLQLAQESGDHAVVADAEHALACANLIGGDEVEAIAHLTRLEAQAEEQGDTARRAWLAANLGSGCGEVRRYRDSVPWLNTAERLAAELDMDQAAAYAAAWQARVAFETGRWEEVADPVRRALGDLDPVLNGRVDGPGGLSYAAVTALGTLGRTRVRRGDPGGREALVNAMDMGADHDFQYLWPVACGLAEDALWRGEVAAGLRWLSPVHAQAMASESAWGRGETSFWMARLGALAAPVAGPIAEPFALSLDGLWSEAAAAWEEFGCPYERALVLLDSGRTDLIGRALQILDSLGARPAAQWGRLLLRKLGESSVPAMPRTSTASNPGSLTNRQREVLELLIDGASNQDIADRLFVSKKTVEHHVSAVYGKLGVSDRPAAMVAGRRLLGD